MVKNKPVNITDLVPGGIYRANLVSPSSEGNSTMDTFSFMTRPSPPTDLKILFLNETYVEFEWKSPYLPINPKFKTKKLQISSKVNGVYPYPSYTIVLRDGNKTYKQETTKTSISFSILMPGKSYEFSIHLHIKGNSVKEIFHKLKIEEEFSEKLKIKFLTPTHEDNKKAIILSSFGILSVVIVMYHLLFNSKVKFISMEAISEELTPLMNPLKFDTDPIQVVNNSLNIVSRKTQSKYQSEFEEIALCGIGAYGSVSKVKQKSDGKLYAIKRILSYCK